MTGRSTRDEASGWPEYERCYSLLVQVCGEDQVWRLAVSGPVAQSPGVPDLIAFSDLRGHAYIQVKHGTGRETASQKRFRQCCERSGTTIITGGVPEVRNWLAPPERVAELQQHHNDVLPLLKRAGL